MDVFIRDSEGRMVVMSTDGRPIVAPGADREALVGFLFMLCTELAGGDQRVPSMTYGYKYDAMRAAQTGLGQGMA